MLEDVLGNWHYNSFISSVARKSGNCCHLSVEFAVVRRLMLDSVTDLPLNSFCKLPLLVDYTNNNWLWKYQYSVVSFVKR